MKIFSVTFVLILIGMLGYGFYSGYSEYVNGYEYFEFEYTQAIGELEVNSYQIGRVSHHSGWSETLDSIIEGTLESCPNCKVISKRKIEVLPEQLIGVFEDRPIGEIYISINTDSHHMADLRIFFRGLPEPLSMEDCKVTKISLEGPSKRVLCVAAK